MFSFTGFNEPSSGNPVYTDSNPPSNLASSEETKPDTMKFCIK